MRDTDFFHYYFFLQITLVDTQSNFFFEVVFPSRQKEWSKAFFKDFMTVEKDYILSFFAYYSYYD